MIKESGDGRTFFQRTFRWLKRTFQFAIGLLIIYLVILLMGLIPVNNDFRQTADGIEIHIVSNPVHADFILPVANSVFDWRKEFPDDCFPADVQSFSHIAFGWGDRGFFLETPTWNDLKTSTAANALLWPSRSCMHVHYTRPDYYPELDTVRISHDQYLALVKYIQSSFDRSEDRYQACPGYHYYKTDAFFEAQGRYHMLNTCNSWVGGGLQAAGVRAPWMSPLPGTPTLYLKTRE